MPERIDRRLERITLHIRRRIDDPDRLLRQIGVLFQVQARRAFEEQRLGTIRWPERYPGQGEPFANLAAMVQRGNLGLPPLARHTKSRRPALRDTGTLFRNIQSRQAITRPGRYTVQVSSNLPYAAIHQWGGEHTIPVTRRAKSVLAKWVKRNPEYRKRIGWLLNKKTTSYTVHVNQRPFFGMTTQIARDIHRLVVEDFTPPREGRGVG